MISFDALIEELGRRLNVFLKLDANRACCIVFDGKIAVTLQMDRKTSQLLVVSELGEIPPGTFCENYFKAALIENGKPLPRFGNFAYSQKNNSVVLFEFLLLPQVSGEFLENYVKLLSEKAITWKEAINSGNLPTREDRGEFGGGLFSLMK